MADPRPTLIVLLLFFWIFQPEPQPLRSRLNPSDRLEHLNRNFNILLNSSFGDFNPPQDKWLNLTGFRDVDRYQWNLLPTAQHLSQAVRQRLWSGHSDLPVYQKIDGDVRGQFNNFVNGSYSGLNLSAVDPSTQYFRSSHVGNVTEKGDLSIKLTNTKLGSKDAVAAKAEVTIWTDSSPNDGWIFNLQGVYHSAGNAILSTSTSKYDALPALPHFAATEVEFAATRRVMNDTLAKIWKTKFDGEEMFSVPDCEMIIWLYQQPILFKGSTPRQAATFLRRVEMELEDPDGAPRAEIPLMSFSAVLFSPDCGFILGADLTGPKSEAQRDLAASLFAGLVLILFLQLLVTKKQMVNCTTPSTQSRISIETFVIGSLGDGLILFGLLYLLILGDTNALLVVTGTFLSGIHVFAFEMRIIFDLWTVQVADPARSDYERRRRDQVRTNTEGLPLPATTNNVTTPAIMSSDQEDPPLGEAATVAGIYGTFYAALGVLLVLSLLATSWPRAGRLVFINLLSLGYLSLWVPQIYRNIIRNCRKALSWEYIIISSLLRTTTVVYWYFEPRNLLGFTTSTTFAWFLIGWVWFQLLVVACQRYLGPRLFVKESWCPPAYDYHPVLKEDDVETAGLLVSRLASASEAKDKDEKFRKVFDCAICMNEIDVHVLTKDGGMGSTWFEQRNHMVTPCRHIFHTDCLEEWMGLRLVCPVCRESLPPQ